MILGYLDANDRAYDLGFATLRLRIRFDRDSAGVSKLVFSSARPPGEMAYRISEEAGVSASVSMDHDGELMPLLRAVDGRLWRHERGVFFLAAPATRPPEDPSYFLVKVRALPTAVQFFFEDQGGTEFISIPDDEILSVSADRELVRVSVTAANIALPKEKLAYAVDFQPAAKAAPLLERLGLSRGSQRNA